MNTDALLARFDRLAVWRRHDVRAPHKPLLLLLALGEYSRGIKALSFPEYEGRLTKLLREFGPIRRAYHPEYPFWRLQKDGVWRVKASDSLRARLSNSDPLRTELRAKHAIGEFSEEVKSLLDAEPRLANEIAIRLLRAHFPETLHEDILAAVGLSGVPEISPRRARSPQFRARILTAYEYQCALCGLDLRIGNVTVGLEAAHIQWHEAGGPDTEANGIALCPLHHKLFDIGAFTVDTSYRVLVSEQVHGGRGFDVALLRHHGQNIFQPARPDFLPSQKFLNWHRRLVFKGAARFLSSGNVEHS